MQDDLFSHRPPAARNTDPQTSHQASARNPGGRAGDCRAVLLAHSKHPDGLTDFELAGVVHRQQTSAGKRRGELRDLGLIASTDVRRPAPSGSPAIVWKITDSGLKEAAKMEEAR